MQASLEALAEALRAELGEDAVRTGEPMAEHTTFRIGGPADVFACPGTADGLASALSTCRDAGVEPFILGRGSDLLVGDGGIRGVVIALCEAFDEISVVGERMRCAAGAAIADASELACEAGLSGLEFACGIPGSAGGAVFMNAGAYDGQVADVLESARVIDGSGDVIELGVSELELGYRTSRVRTEGLVVVDATFKLAPARRERIRATMDDLTRRREEKQPLELPSAGSTFKRPEGYFAGKLITDAGLKGFSAGGAAVSEKHAGFVVNTGGATAADVRAVIAHVQDEVRRQFGVELEPEVRFVGEF